VRIEIAVFLATEKPFARRLATLHRQGYIQGHNAFWQVAFPPQGLRNGALPDDLKKSPTAFYFRVHLSPGPMQRALHCGRQQVSVANGKAIYSCKFSARAEVA